MCVSVGEDVDAIVASGVGAEGGDVRQRVASTKGLPIYHFHGGRDGKFHKRQTAIEGLRTNFSDAMTYSGGH